MAAGTSITPNDTPGVVASGTFVLDPGSISASGREEQTVAIPEAKSGDTVIVNPPADLGAGLLVVPAVVSDGSISFYLENQSAGSIDVASGTWSYTIIRGSNAPSGLG